MSEKYDYVVFIRETYEKTWREQTMIEAGKRRTSESITNTARLIAQRKAIDKTFVEALLKFSPHISEDEIWSAIGMTHKLNIADLRRFGIDESIQEEVFLSCLSAHQSWIKSSGHSFERYIASIENAELKNQEIRFILQSEMTDMIKKHKLNNTKEDIAGLNAWGKDYDLYAVQTVHGEEHIFGCIQSKTSIRDRVGRDVTFSRNAMEGLFWSVAVTLDGAFLNMPEFIHMVNGGGSYPQNGWHGMYAISGISEDNGRIYKVDDRLKRFADHAIEAAKQFIKDRRQLNNTWRTDIR